ncbi:hypothetical protein V8E55_000094 [Tylopilus felleus]
MDRLLSTKWLAIRSISTSAVLLHLCKGVIPHDIPIIGTVLKHLKFPVPRIFHALASLSLLSSVTNRVQVQPGCMLHSGPIRIQERRSNKRGGQKKTRPAYLRLTRGKEPWQFTSNQQGHL